MPSTDNIDKTLGELAARHAAPLASKLHADRTAALQTAQQQIDNACDRQRDALRNDLQELQASREARLAAATAAAETARRARAAALLADVFARGPGSLVSLVHDHCVEPGRALAIKIRAQWDAFNQRAVQEIGSPLAPHVLGQIICDVVLDKPGFGAAANAMSDLQFGSADALYLSANVTTASTPAAIENALIDAESRMVAAASRYLANNPNAKPDPSLMARHALRRTNATHGDLVNATAALDQVQGAAAQAAWEKSYVPPDSLSTILRRQLGIAAD